MKKASIFGILSIGISMFSFAQQQQDSTQSRWLSGEQLVEVVISDSRFKLKRENSGKTVIKISQQEIERNQGRTVSELINTKSGIEINGSRSVEGQNLGTFVRGGNNRQVLVLIDGVQINDPSIVANDFDLRLLNLNTIESIEIIKGASSTLYGNAAATAVISITTKKSSKKEISGSFLTVVGTNQTQDDLNYNGSSFTNNVSVNGTVNRFTYLASFGNRFVDGLSAAKSDTPEKDPFSRYNTNLKIGYEFSDNFEMTAYASYDKFKTDIDGFPPPTYAFVDTEYEYVSQQKRVGVSPKLTYENGSFQVNAAYTKIDRETISDFGSVNEADSYVIDAFNKYVFDDTFYTIVGLNYGDYNSLFVEEESFTNTDPYLNVVYVSDFGLNINAGGRLNNHSEYGSYFVYSLNPSYRIKSNYGSYKIFGSYATSFIAPNLSQLFGFFGANPDLRPEENKTLEAGFEFNDGKGFRASTVFFNRKEENTIIYTTAYENAITNATVQGSEFEFETSFIKNLDFSVNLTYLEVKDGERLRVPNYKANASLGYDFSKTTYASLNYQFVGSRTDTNFSTFLNQELSSYSLIDLYFSHKIIKNKLTLFANVTNVLNEDYFEILGYTTKGRNVSLGLNLKL